MNRRSIIAFGLLLTTSFVGCRTNHHDTDVHMVATKYVAANAAPGALMPAKPSILPRYEIFVDLTGSINIIKDGKVTTRLPQLTVGTVMALINHNGEGQFTIDIRGLTAGSNSEEYVLSHTFNGENEGPAQTQAFLRRLPKTITGWIERYQQRGLKGTDVYGCLFKMATISRGLLPDQEIVGIFLSDLIHEVAPDPGRAHFERKFRVYTLLANDEGDPKLLDKARLAFTHHVEDSGGSVTQAADTGVLAALLQTAGGASQ